MLNLPTEVVASEFLTLEGKQFSTSRKHVIYVQDIVARYGPDPIRYFICAAGPENQDADFSWAEFVQRNNSEARRRLGQPRQPHGRDDRQELRRDPEGVCRRTRRRGACWLPCGVRSRPSAPPSSGTGRRPPSPRSCGSWARPTPTSRGPSRSRLKGDDQRERLSTVLHTLAQAVSDINTLISPFLPHAANRVHAVLGGAGEFMPMPRLEVVPDLDDDARSLPGHHRRVLLDAALGVAAGRRRDARREAVRGLRQGSTPSRSSRRSAPASATPRRAERGTTPTPSRRRGWASRRAEPVPTATRPAVPPPTRHRPHDPARVGAAGPAGDGARPAAHRRRGQPRPPRHHARGRRAVRRRRRDQGRPGGRCDPARPGRVRPRRDPIHHGCHRGT